MLTDIPKAVVRIHLILVPTGFLGKNRESLLIGIAPWHGTVARGSRRASQHRAFRWLGGRLSLRPQYDRCLIRADLTVGHRAGIDLLLSLRRAAVAIR